MKISENQNVERFLSKILAKVKFQEAHNEIRMEYHSHIEEAAETGLSYGLSPEQSIEEALRRLGQPHEIGESLNRIHTPKIDWTLIGVCLFLGSVGLYTLSGLGFAAAQSVWAILGLLLGLGFLFITPSTLLRQAPSLYVTTLLLLVWAHLSGITFNQQPYLVVGALRLKIVDLSVVLFLISVVGLSFRLGSTKRESPLVIIATALPLFYYALIGSVFAGFVYFISIMTLIISRRRAWTFVSLCTAGGLLLLAWASRGPAFVSPEKFSELQSQEAHTDFIFSSVAHQSPLLSVAVILGFGLLLSRALLLGTQIKNPFSLALFKASLTMIGTSAIWGIASGLGYFPMPQTGVHLPFLSYGGSLMVADLSLIGMMAGLHRRKFLQYS